MKHKTCITKFTANCQFRLLVKISMNICRSKPNFFFLFDIFFCLFARWNCKLNDDFKTR